ncbi:hypothetical protein B5P44_00830 [Mycobacterium sp. CBMA 213]|uniref:Uncharacterized protein n=1 Tax=Mycolicibacterium sp. CBMA 213 TaxID=1968788 RepID=A0A343VRF2_9MYCO|nr:MULTISPECIES: hypothetical protein [unclassified Mycolicibacterium]AVN58476.1 hypothetical protein B5P44_p00181 [Mycolicibacterium sp. CBMA 213]MUL61130.1 hypothetical protein [Mycolicibacterium sp. CBMA 335]MUM03367.1 hypothetical protein [Mycolicibacterium sp. CBMA 213]
MPTWVTRYWLTIDDTGTPGIGHDTVERLLDNHSAGTTFWIDVDTPMAGSDPNRAGLNNSDGAALLLRVEFTGNRTLRHASRDDDEARHPEAFKSGGYIDVAEVQIVTVHE